MDRGSWTPIGPHGDQANWGNGYTYTGGSPVLHSDPLGLYSVAPGASGGGQGPGGNQDPGGTQDPQDKPRRPEVSTNLWKPKYAIELADALKDLQRVRVQTPAGARRKSVCAACIRSGKVRKAVS